MKVHHIIQGIQDWVKEHTAQSPGYVAAYLVGTLAHMPPDAVFPRSRGIDVCLIFKDRVETSLQICHKDIVFECQTRSWHDYTLETALSNPGLSANLAANSLLDDPSGLLKQLQRQIRSEYNRPEWIRARCNFEYRSLLTQIERMDHFLASTAQASLFQSALVSLARLVAVAHLQPPTTRRSFVVMRDVLHKTGHVDIHEYVLEIAGFAHLSRRQVEAYLIDAMEAFDMTLSLKSFSHAFDHKLHPYVRAQLVDGAHELISHGYHREAMSWISMFYLNCCDVIERDGDEPTRARFALKSRDFLNDLGLSSRFKRKDRSELAKVFAQEIYNMMDDVIAAGSYPDQASV